MSEFELFAVRYGDLRSTAGRELYGRAYEPGADEAQRVSYYFWVARSESSAILIDTGFAPEVGERRGRTMTGDVRHGLDQLGLGPGDISAILVTHFHYDHIGNIPLFPGARVLCAREEFEFWTSPLSKRRVYRSAVEDHELAFMEDLHRDGRLELIDVGVDPGLGIDPILLPGHTAGQLGALVQAPLGPVLLTSDAAHFYSEIEGDEVFRIFGDLDRFLTSVDRIRELAEDPRLSIVPGHDAAVPTRCARGLSGTDDPDITRLG